MHIHFNFNFHDKYYSLDEANKAGLAHALARIILNRQRQHNFQLVCITHDEVCAVLYCTVLYCTVLYCAVLYCTVLYCTVLYCTVLYCTILYLLYLPHPFYIMSFDMILFTFPSFLLTLFSHSILSFESLRFLAHHFINFSIFLLPHCLTILLNIFLILVSTSAPYISSVSVSMLVCVIRISFD